MQNRRFFQDDIYKLNREISWFTDQEKKKVVLSAYNPINLCVNYFSVYKGDDVDRWQFHNEHEKAVQKFLDVEGKDDFKKFLDRHAYTKPFKKYRDADLHYFLLNLYNNFPVNPRLFFDGIIKRVLSEFIQNGKLLKYAFIDPIDPKGNNFEFKYFPWIDVRLFYYRDKHNDHPEMGIRACQESGNFSKYGKWFKKQRELDEVISSSDVEGQPLYPHLEKYFFQYLLPFFNAYKYDNEDRFDGKDELFPLKVSQVKPQLIVPFYDSWIGIDERPCGMIQGNLFIPLVKDEFKNYKRKKEFIKENLNKYTELSRSISQLLHESRTHELLKLPTQPEDDTLRNFLRKIACVQEWKRILVFNKSGNHPELELRYCFTRFRGGKANNLLKTNNLLEYEEEWNICKKEKSGCEKSCLPPKLKGFLKDEFREGNNVHQNEKDNTYLFCIMLEDILRLRILPSVEGMDISRYKNHILCFEFPKHTFFPKAKGGNDKNEGVKRLGEHYIDKLIPIFDRLLLSRKVLKHSIKSAVAAIMSRNMSHNIGSHILARIECDEVSQNVKENLENSFKAEIAKQMKKNNNRISQNTIDKNAKCQIDKYEQQIERNIPEICGKLIDDFHKYIQKKNDFLAEISTEPYRSPRTALFYRDVILPFTENILLLDYIARNEGMTYDKVSINVFSKSKETGCCCEIKITQYQSIKCKGKDHLTKFKKMPFHRICPICRYQYQGEFEETLYAQYSIQNAEYDVKIDIPGSVGEFAVYNIIEAIIRNATKHNVTENKITTTLDVNILIEDDPEEHSMYLFTIWDNLSDKNKVELMNGKIKEEIVDQSTGKLNLQNWGISEMKICAALLQNRSFDEIASSPEKFLKAIPIHGKLGYQFKILKARRSIMIGENNWGNFCANWRRHNEQN